MLVQVFIVLVIYFKMYAEMDCKYYVTPIFLTPQFL